MLLNLARRSALVKCRASSFEEKAIVFLSVVPCISEQYFRTKVHHRSQSSNRPSALKNGCLNTRWSRLTSHRNGKSWKNHFLPRVDKQCKKFSTLLSASCDWEFASRKALFSCIFVRESTFWNRYIGRRCQWILWCPQSVIFVRTKNNIPSWLPRAMPQSHAKAKLRPAS